MRKMGQALLRHTSIGWPIPRMFALIKLVDLFLRNGLTQESDYTAEQDKFLRGAV
ncbi:MAG: hypothetical protein NT075_35085 [Chloroflexi bacterium]|nr:hypothetical protein [Chloroflexota bacterium]